MRRPKGDRGPGNRSSIRVYTRRIMVSKAALLAATVTVGLLAPAPAVLQANWLAPSNPRPASLLQVERGDPAECSMPRQELRFEMLAADAKVQPYASGPALCMAVYQPSVMDPWGNAARH
jgi:hypothetical protein